MTYFQAKQFIREKIRSDSGLGIPLEIDSNLLKLATTFLHPQMIGEIFT